jgi:predicted secreted protein
MKQIMKILFVAIIILISGVLLLSSCSELRNQKNQQTPQPKEVQITEKGNACGTTVGLNAGDTLNLILDGNLSTGYTWEVGFYANTVVEPLGEPEYQSQSNLVGADGTYTFQFRAIGEGETQLKMIYHRPLEKDAPDLKTCDVILNVK